MARRRTGTLVWQKRGWSARIPVVVDGVTVKQVFFLGTDSKAVARRKLARLIEQIERGEQPGAVDAARVDTFAEAAERVHEQRKKDGVKSAADEIARLRAYALPIFGALPATKITTALVNEVLDDCKAKGRGRQTTVHLKQDVGNVLAALRRDGSITSNPADDAEVPAYPEGVRKERAVLTDEELVRYLGWQHPDERFRAAVLERQVMACVARMFGGLRTGDLHALSWESLDSERGEFLWGWAARRKTSRPQKLEIPAMLRPILKDWWRAQKKPTVGPVFPVRRGERAGEEKRKASHADALRKDLARAFGLEVWSTAVTERSNGRKLTRQAWVPSGRRLTPRERELFEGTEFVLPVDFHSWRRAYSQALADADVTVQQAQALAGHASMSAHERYLRNAAKMRRLPPRALPRLDISHVQMGGSQIAKSLSGWQDLNLQQPAPKAGPLPG
jgi:integrase